MSEPDLTTARYISVATFRKSGAEVATPVWCACAGGTFYVFSAGDAGKVKRLRARDDVRLAVCDVRGRVLGPWHDGKGRILTDADDVARALAALRAKYGLQMALTDVLARMTGRFGKRAYLALTLNADTSGAE